MDSRSVAARTLSRRATDVSDTLRTQTSVSAEGLINLGSGTPEFPTPAHIIEAGKQALDEGHTKYTSWSGYPELKEAIAEKLARDNSLSADPKREILVTTGGQEAVLVTMLALLDPGDEVLIPSPFFEEYHRVVTIAGGHLVTVPTIQENNFQVDPTEIETRIGPKTKAIVLVTPCNPTGTVLSRATLEQIASLAAYAGPARLPT